MVTCFFVICPTSSNAKISACDPPILNVRVGIKVRFNIMVIFRISVRFRVRVQFRVRVRVKDSVMVVMIFRVRVWFYLSIQWRVKGRYLSLKNILQASIDDAYKIHSVWCFKRKC